MDLTNDLSHAIPLLTLLGLGLALMLADAFKANRLLPILTAAGLILSAALAFTGDQTYFPYFNKMIYFGGIASLVHAFLCISGAFALFFVEDYLKRYKQDIGEAYSLIVFAIIGMVMLANANDLIILFVGLEIMSICLYIMAGLFPRQNESNESGLKYFLLGAFATGFLLYGIALLYGLSGIPTGMQPTTKLHILAERIPAIVDHKLFYIAVGLILVGFLFKVAAFPFHSWTPDVYTGAPTPLAGFMATASKLASFVAFSMFLMRVLPASSQAAQDKILGLIAVMAILSMLYGNLVAVQQTNIKRLLAYSSIAHTGYLMLGLCAGPQGYMGVLFYMFIYTLMTLGAFGVISMVESSPEDSELSRWKGLGRWRPGVGIAMSAFMFSMAGLPPLAGFMGKYMVFGAAVKAGYVGLAVVAILASVIGAYYYLKVLVVMYFQQEDSQPTGIYQGQTVPLAGALLLVGLLILLGAYPTPISNYIDHLYAQAGFLTLK